MIGTRLANAGTGHHPASRGTASHQRSRLRWIALSQETPARARRARSLRAVQPFASDQRSMTLVSQTTLAVLEPVQRRALAVSAASTAAAVSAAPSAGT